MAGLTKEQIDAWNKRNQGAFQGLLNVNQFVPVTGDIQSGIMAGQDVSKGNYGSAALNSLGLLPFIPALGGITKKTMQESPEIISAFDKGMSNFLNDTGYAASILPNGNVKIYHGTSQKNADAIMKSGKFKGFPWFSPDKSVAEKFSKQAGKNPTILELEVDKSALVPTGGYLSARKEGLVLGKDGIWRYE